MLPDPSHLAVGYSGIENDAAAIGDHVDVESLHGFVRSFASPSVIPSVERDLPSERKILKLPSIIIASIAFSWQQ
jgi:hypothetical protein